MLRSCLLSEGLGREGGFRVPASCWMTLGVSAIAIIY